MAKRTLDHSVSETSNLPSVSRRERASSSPLKSAAVAALLLLIGGAAHRVLFPSDSSGSSRSDASPPSRTSSPSPASFPESPFPRFHSSFQPSDSSTYFTVVQYPARNSSRVFRPGSGLDGPPLSSDLQLLQQHLISLCEEFYHGDLSLHLDPLRPPLPAQIQQAYGLFRDVAVLENLPPDFYDFENVCGSYDGALARANEYVQAVLDSDFSRFEKYLMLRHLPESLFGADLEELGFVDGLAEEGFGVLDEAGFGFSFSFQSDDDLKEFQQLAHRISEDMGSQCFVPEQSVYFALVLQDMHESLRGAYGDLSDFDYSGNFGMSEVKLKKYIAEHVVIPELIQDFGEFFRDYEYFLFHSDTDSLAYAEYQSHLYYFLDSLLTQMSEYLLDPKRHLHLSSSWDDLFAILESLKLTDEQQLKLSDRKRVYGDAEVD